jgi:hypothetical protein
LWRPRPATAICVPRLMIGRSASDQGDGCHRGDVGRAGHRLSGADAGRWARRVRLARTARVRCARRARRAVLASAARLACSCISSSRTWPRDWTVVGDNIVASSGT